MSVNPVELLTAFLANDNSTRQQAEAYMNRLSEENPNKSFELYLEAIDLENNSLSELAAVSLKKYHLQKSETFAKISGEHIRVLATKLINLIEAGTKSGPFYRRCSEILALIYSNESSDGLAIIQALFKLCDSEHAKVRIAIIYFVELLCDYCFDENALSAFSNDLLILFDKYMNDNDISVKVAATKGITAFLSSIDDENFLKKFTQILPVLIKTLVEAINNDQDSGVTTIQSISDLIESHPDIVKPYLEDILDILSQIFRNKSFTHGLRNQAITAVYMCTNTLDVALRKSENFKNLVLPAFIEVLCEIDDIDLDEWLKDIDNQTVSKTDPTFVVQDLVPKISDVLKPKFMLTNYIPYIKQCFDSGKWNAQYAGITLMGVLAEGSSKFFKNELDGIVNFVIPGFQSEDPRVIYATITAIALLCNEYSPDIQKKYHKEILENFLKIMKDDRYVKLQKQATSALVNFCQDILEEEKESKFISNYADELLSALIKLFQTAQENDLKTLLEEVLNGISMISSVIDNEFAKYYDTFMPGLKKLLESISDEDETKVHIRLLAMECISFIATSIRDEDRFISETESLMESFITLQNKLDIEDSQHGPILDFYCQISAFLKENFAKYMDYIYDKVIKMMELKTKFVSAGNEEGPDKKFAVKGKINAKLFQFDHFTLDTAAIANKTAACNTVFSLSRNLGKAFYKYIPQTLPLVVQYFKDTLSLISDKAVKSVKNMVMACENESDVVGIINNAVPTMIEVIQSRLKVADCPRAFYLLKQINKNIAFITTPSLDQNLVSNLVNIMAEAISVCKSEKNTLLTKFKKLKDVDQEKQDEFTEQYETVNDLMQIVMDISSKLMEIYKDKIENLLANGIAPYYFEVAQNPDATENEILYFICFFDSFFENCSQDFFEKGSAMIMKYFINFSNKQKNLDILQSSVYGLGVIAKRMDQNSFASYKTESLSILSNIITASDAFSEDKAVCTDNAIGALGKIAIYQGQTNDNTSNEVLNKFLELLPLKNDCDEAQAIHKLFLKEIAGKNQYLATCNQDTQNLMIRAIKSIAEHHTKNPDDEIIDEEGKQLIESLIGK